MIITGPALRQHDLRPARRRLAARRMAEAFTMARGARAQVREVAR